MRGAQWVLLIYVHAAVEATNPRSVNLALETTFEFNEKKDMEFIKNMRQFFDKVENNVEKKLIARERSEGYRFTDFLQELIAVLISYDDNDFRGVFKELYHVINNQRKGGAELNDIMSNALRPALLEAMRKNMESPTRLLKDRLKRISLLLSKTDKSHASFVNFLNLLYKGKSPMTLKRIIRGFRLLRKRPNPESQLRQLVRNAVEYLVYEHYAGLDGSVKRDVGKWLRAMLKRDVSVEYRQTLKQKVTSTPSKRTRYTFVTLYPEPIDFSVKKYQRQSEQVTAWKRVTLKNQARFLLVRGERRNGDNIRGERKNTGNVSGESEESSWSSLEIATPAKKPPMSVYGKHYQQRIHSVKPSSLLDYSHRREINDTGPLEAKNITRFNDSVSYLYLERLKQLEDQLKVMKMELKARMSLPEPIEPQTDIEYDNLAVDKDELETDTKNASKSTIDRKTNGTDVIQTRFRTAVGNKSLVLGDSQLSTEIKEFLKTKPKILEVTNAASIVPPVNDTMRNSTTETNVVIVKRSRDETEPTSTTVACNIASKSANIAQGADNVTTTTTIKMELSANKTIVGKLGTNTTTSGNERLNNTIIVL